MRNFGMMPCGTRMTRTLPFFAFVLARRAAAELADGEVEEVRNAESSVPSSTATSPSVPVLDRKNGIR
jgi:hypothetical protein